MRRALTALTVFILLGFACTASCAAEDNQIFSGLAQRLLEHMKYGEPHTAELTALQIADPAMLYVELHTDCSKKAFWINLYNALAQLKIQSSAELYADRKNFFTSKTFIVARHMLSLDDIEHRMLRRAEPGFLPRSIRPLFMSGFMRRLSLTRLDPRIHFALNCNARSCPAILFYDADKIDDQLDMAAQNYLKTSVVYDAAANVVVLPELFRWFSDDFGKRQGIIDLLKHYGIIGQGISPSLTYKSWGLVARTRAI